MTVLHSSDPTRGSQVTEAQRENHTIAERLEDVARLLDDQRADDFRVRAYRSAAKTIRDLPTSVREIVDREGVDGLISLPTIGKSIANLIEHDVRLGRMPLLDRLRGEASAEQYFTNLPGIGPELSHRIYEHLHIETLPELYAASRDGRLDQVPGLGRKRIRAIQDNLARRFQGRPDDSTSSFPQTDRSVPVAELLEIDATYRKLASEGRLPKIAPHNFNPGHIAWLPIMHTERSGRHYTALFSNTAHAHQCHTTKDWVVIYRDDAHSHGRWTVITAHFGRLRDCRIVRGREDECEKYYRQPKPGLPKQFQFDLGDHGDASGMNE